MDTFSFNIISKFIIFLYVDRTSITESSIYTKHTIIKRPNLKIFLFNFNKFTCSLNIGFNITIMLTLFHRKCFLVKL